MNDCEKGSSALIVMKGTGELIKNSLKQIALAAEMPENPAEEIDNLPKVFPFKFVDAISKIYYLIKLFNQEILMVVV